MYENVSTIYGRNARASFRAAAYLVPNLIQIIRISLSSPGD